MNPPRGRGAAGNPPNRFEGRSFVPDPEAADPEEPLPRTQFLKDTARSVVVLQSSPDIGMEASLNPYRGCEHGCAYCYARPTHEYLGFSAGLDFETRILVKEDAPELLRKELSSPRWKPRALALSGVTDPYQPAERRLLLTRRCLEVLAEFGNPVAVITKNFLVTRDADLLARLAARGAAAAILSITTLDPDLARALEPRTSIPARRLEAIRRLSAAGVPVGVNVAPVIPGLTDHEIPAILRAAREAGAGFAGHTMLRLPGAVAEIFSEWLARHRPGRRGRVLARLRDVRGGRLNDPRFGSRMTGEGPYAAQIHALFRAACRRAGLSDEAPALSTASFRVPPGPQRELFEAPTPDDAPPATGEAEGRTS
ncbi:MAG TPA: PA0069 family radical SAM protein [Planctomycetota bacterium]|nr:PA0069 family radical SAM protein [Planctomycetota bacterium]